MFITSSALQKMNPQVAAGLVQGTDAVSTAGMRVLAIACRSGGYVAAGAGIYRGSVERVSASAILALVRSGHLEHLLSPDGGCAGRLSARSLARLSQAPGGA